MNIENGLYVLEIMSNTLGKPENIYPTLICDNDSLILIDAGIPGLGNQICDAIKKEVLDLCNLNKIIFTHQDIDHIGSANDIVKIAPNKITTYSIFAIYAIMEEGIRYKLYLIILFFSNS